MDSSCREVRSFPKKKNRETYSRVLNRVGANIIVRNSFGRDNQNPTTNILCYTSGMEFFEKLHSLRKKEKTASEIHTSTPESNNDSSLESLRRTMIDDLSARERVLTQTELLLITDANRRTSIIMEQYDVPPKDADSNNVHVIPIEKWLGGDAFFVRELNGLVVPELHEEKSFLLCLIHEMFHLKGINFLPIPVTEAIVERLTNEAFNLGNASLSDGRRFSGSYTYIDYMRAFDSLLEKIIQNSPHGVTNLLHAYSFFAKTHLSGNIEHLSFLNDLFGQDTVQTFNALDDQLASFQEFIKNLETKKF